MASNVTLATLRTRVRQRTHYEQSQFVTDPELTAWVNDSVKELYDLLTTTFQGYAVTSTDFAVASGNTITLPADFYKLLGVDQVVALPDQLASLPRVQFADRNSGKSGYDLRGSTLVLFPYAAAAGHSYRLHYVPTPTALAADADTLDGLDGYDELVVLDVALKVCAKSGEDASIFGAQKAAMLDRVLSSAHSRDAGEPPHTTDLHGASGGGTWLAGRWLGDS
jgi:hypothetical protein